MRLSQLVAWYQKKIGSYDKQQWEKTLEEKILLSGLTLPLKSTKLKTDLIDVDLVRGSTFPKAKSKQSFLTVLYLSILRFVFLPLFSKWWVKETSPRVFILLLFLYILQMINWAIYSLNINKVEFKNVRGGSSDDDEHIVPLSELLVPMGLSMLLCFVHSQIVATSSNSTRSSNQRKHNMSHHGRRHHEKLRRRKKTFRSRSNVSTEDHKSSGSDYEHRNSSKTSQLRNNKQQIKIDQSKIDVINGKNKLNFNEQNNFKEIIHSGDSDETTVVMKSSVKLESSLKTPNLRKRNVSVNWDSPIKQVDCPQHQQHHIDENREEEAPVQPNPIEDDGFESYNTGKSSSGEDNSILIHLSQNNCNLVDSNSNSDTDTLKNSEKSTPVKVKCAPPIVVPQKPPIIKKKKSKESSDTDEENNEDVETLTPASSTHQFTETEYIGVTTNSDYSSEIDQSESQLGDDDDLEFDATPTSILDPRGDDSSERVSCFIWTKQHEAKAEIVKCEMSVLDISSAIIERVEGIPETCDYVYIGLILSVLLSLTPTYCRLCEATIDSNNSTEIPKLLLEIPRVILLESSFSSYNLLQLAFGKTNWEKTILILSFVQRLILTFLFFFLLAVAERAFKQRFLYAKLFSHLTSSRRARKSEIPHFRLNKVKHIKGWLSVRSYLKRLGPQRSVDVIVSATFITTLLLLAFLSLEFLKDSEHMHASQNLDALMWSCALGVFLLRFMTLGTKINKKYRSISVLITEQINLYVQIEQKPQKKEELMISNSVLKLASDLLKELESPFKISGLSANSYLYNTVKVVILSALSGVLSEMLGFKLKLHKIKIK